MTLDTRIYVHGRVDYRQVFDAVNQLLGATEMTRFDVRPDSVGNLPGQGLPAWLIVYCDPSGMSPHRPAGQHGVYCAGEEDGCMEPCAVPCWLEVSVDTAYGYWGPEGGCGGLHAWIITELGEWLDSRGLKWSWRNEFTGDVYQGTEGLATLTG